MSESLVVIGVLAIIVVVIIAKTAVVVPQQSAFVIERLGKYSNTLEAGFHILMPFVDAIRYKHSLKEIAIDIPEQVCITNDNVQVGVDGVLYMKILDPERTSYGITDHTFAITQLAQTTLRSEVGKIALDRTFEERTNINFAVVSELDKATEAWGVKVLRYEIKNITPPTGHPGRDGEADAGGAREARDGAYFGRAEGCRDQQCGGREAAGHQALRGQETAADKRS